jgi:hypothetical protein
MKIRTAAMIAAFGFAVGLAGCETATPYQPLVTGGESPGGFTDQRLDANHVRVTFQGNTSTTRDRVESYMLYRAAELTVNSGYDWFETADRHTDKDQKTYWDTPDVWGPGPYPFWRPYWRRWGPYGWGGWGGWGWDGETTTVEKFQATVEITMGHGAKPDARALDAREVMTNLGPKIQRPKA